MFALFKRFIVSPLQNIYDASFAICLTDMATKMLKQLPPRKPKSGWCWNLAERVLSIYSDVKKKRFIHIWHDIYFNNRLRNWHRYISINDKWLKCAIKAEEQVCRYHSKTEQLLDIGTLTRMPSHVAVARRWLRWCRAKIVILSYAESDSYTKLIF